jgi:predicted transport protein
MSDIKLFRTSPTGVAELEGTAVAVERDLQRLMESHLQTFLGVRFLASEYSTGRVHGGRIDTLGIDENGCPVIIEYKRASNENVINQGLFYLDWLLDHRGEFTLLVQRQLGADAEAMIDWSTPRLLCIAGDFNRYDEHAVAQINRNIDLLRYRRYGDDFLILELVNATTAGSDGGGTTITAVAGRRPQRASGEKSVSDYLAQADDNLSNLYEALDAYCLALGDDVQRKILKLYFAYRRIKNFACVEVHPQSRKLLVYVKVDPSTVDTEPGFTRDVTAIGHFGTGDLEITLGSLDDFERAKPLLQASYERS